MVEYTIRIYSYVEHYYKLTAVENVCQDQKLNKINKM